MSALAICTKPAPRVVEAYYDLAGQLRNEQRRRFNQNASERIKVGTKYQRIESP
jgi:hypothetical protein